MLEFKNTIDLSDVIAAFAPARITLAMAKEILKNADANVPEDTGALKRSGRIEARPDGSTAVIYGGKGAEHAAIVHDGIVKVTSGSPQWLRDAAMDKTKVMAAAAAEGRKIMREAAAKAKG